MKRFMLKKDCSGYKSTNHTLYYSLGYFFASVAVTKVWSGALWSVSARDASE